MSFYIIREYLRINYLGLYNDLIPLNDYKYMYLYLNNKDIKVIHVKLNDIDEDIKLFINDKLEKLLMYSRYDYIQIDHQNKYWQQLYSHFIYHPKRIIYINRHKYLKKSLDII